MPLLRRSTGQYWAPNPQGSQPLESSDSSSTSSSSGVPPRTCARVLSRTLSPSSVRGGVFGPRAAPIGTSAISDNVSSIAPPTLCSPVESPSKTLGYCSRLKGQSVVQCHVHSLQIRILREPKLFPHIPQTRNLPHKVAIESAPTMQVNPTNCLGVLPQIPLQMGDIAPQEVYKNHCPTKGNQGVLPQITGTTSPAFRTGRPT